MHMIPAFLAENSERKNPQNVEGCNEISLNENHRDRDSLFRIRILEDAALCVNDKVSNVNKFYPFL